MFFESSTKFIADQLGKGTWKGGDNKGTSPKATFKSASGHYKGTIKLDGSTSSATVSPGTPSGC